MRYDINIYGQVPDCLEIEAVDEYQAVELAKDDVLDRLDFKAAPAEEGSTCEKPQKNRAAGGRQARRTKFKG